MGTAPAFRPEDDVVEERAAVTEEDTPAVKRDIIAYPNPFTGELTVEFEQTTTEAPIVVVSDALGRVVLKNMLPTGELGQRIEVLNMEGIGTGYYILQIIDGKQHKSIRIMKQ